MTIDTVRLARRILVEGVPPSEIAKETGLSKQRVGAMVNRVLAVAKGIPKGWEHVEVWLPPELAAQVRQMEQDARNAIANIDAN
jgi:TrfB plasmid transcriptional repressor